MFTTCRSYTHTIITGLLVSSIGGSISKNKRSNMCSSENYTQIAISSFMGELFDSIVLEEQQDICSSMLKETIDYYNDNNTDCYLLLLDDFKAFDCVEYIYMKLFSTLRIE